MTALTNPSGTSAQANAQTQTQIAQNRIVATAYARTTLDNFASAIDGGQDELTGAAARAYPRYGRITASSVNETDDGSATVLSTSKVTVTPAECLLGINLTDAALAGLSPSNLKSFLCRLLGRGYADYVDSQGLAQISNADSGNTVGTTATAVTLDVFLQAISKLENQNPDGPFAAILGNTTTHNLRTKIGGTSGSTAPVFMRQEILDRIGPSQPTGPSPGLPAGMASNYTMTLYNVDCFRSTNVALSSTGTDTESMMFPVMPGFFPFVRLIMRFPSQAAMDVSMFPGGVQQDTPPLAPGALWDCRYEEQRDASGRVTEMWVGGKWAWGVVATNWLAPITGVN